MPFQNVEKRDDRGSHSNIKDKSAATATVVALCRAQVNDRPRHEAVQSPEQNIVDLKNLNVPESPAALVDDIIRLCLRDEAKVRDEAKAQVVSVRVINDH